MSLLSMLLMRPWGCWVMRKAKRSAGKYGMYCQRFPVILVVGCTQESLTLKVYMLNMESPSPLFFP